MEFNNKIAVVTGAGDGMGRELVRQLIEAGAHVAACDVSAGGLEATKASVGDAADRLTTHIVDVSDEQAMQQFAKEVDSAHATDHIDLLFNNAGIAGGGSLFTDTPETWNRTFGVDFFGVLYGVRAFLPMLVASSEARIVNTSSVNGFWATVGPTTPHTAYAAAKFAVKGFTEALIADLRVNAPHVACSVVMPGHIGTGIVANSHRVHVGGDEVDEMVAAGSKAFVDMAPMSAAEAATVILDGVRSGKWRILVGDDAVALDEWVRDDPENAYTEAFYTKFAAEHGWELGARRDVGRALREPK